MASPGLWRMRRARMYASGAQAMAFRESLDLECFAVQPRNLNLGHFKAGGRVAIRGPGPRRAREIVLKETS